EILVNGKAVSNMNDFKLPTKLGNENETIQYVYTQDSYSATVKVMDGATQVSSETTTGIEGTAIKIPTLPKGAKVTSVEINGVKQPTNSYPIQIGNANEIITINVEMPHTATVEYKEGNTIIGSAVTTGVEGTTIRYAAVPTGYKIKSITVNGKVVDSMPTTLGNANETIVVTYEKIAVPVKPEAKKVKLTVEATSGGKTLFSETVSGAEGSELSGLKEVPAQNGYKLKEILVNGKAVSNMNDFKLPTKLGNENETIQYVYTQDSYSATVKVMDGATQVSSETTTGIEGTAIKIPTLPKGAKVTSVEINGVKQPTNSYPIQIGNKNETITINVEMPHTATVEYKEGNTTIGSAVTTGVGGTTIKYAAVPTGYKIKSITVNGKVVNSMPKTLGNANETIVVTYEKIVNNTKPTTPPTKPDTTGNPMTNHGELQPDGTGAPTTGTNPNTTGTPTTNHGELQQNGTGVSTTNTTGTSVTNNQGTQSSGTTTESNNITNNSSSNGAPVVQLPNTGISSVVNTKTTEKTAEGVAIFGGILAGLGLFLRKKK
ncbi:MAG: hypothetical protein ACRCX8_14040, partial [Sarcina sp.]